MTKVKMAFLVVFGLFTSVGLYADQPSECTKTDAGAPPQTYQRTDTQTRSSGNDAELRRGPASVASSSQPVHSDKDDRGTLLNKPWNDEMTSRGQRPSENVDDLVNRSPNWDHAKNDR